VDEDRGLAIVANPKYDWASIRQEYSNAIPQVSQVELCRKYGINQGTMCRKARKENWEFERATFLRMTSEETTEKKADAVSSFAATWNTKCADAADKLLAKALGEMATDSKSRDVAAAMKIAQDMGKIASGGKPDGVLEQLVAEIKKALA